MASAIHISLSAEKVFSIAGLDVTNSMLTSVVVSGILITFAILVNSSLKSTNRPKGLQNFAEWLVESLYNLTHSVAGSDMKTRVFFPFIATFFLFILLNNYAGLIPGVGSIGITEEPAEVALVQQVQAVTTPAVDTHAAEVTPDAESHAAPVAGEAEHTETTAAAHGPKFVPLFRAATADLNTTLALALISVVTTQIFGFKYLGLSYLKKYFNFSNPMMTFVGLLEIVSELAKVVSFAFRLFGNIFAGEVLLVVITSLLPIIGPMPFYGLEFFVGFVQALVFSMLSLVFFNMATHSHESH